MTRQGEIEGAIRQLVEEKLPGLGEALLIQEKEAAWKAAGWRTQLVTRKFLLALEGQEEQLEGLFACGYLRVGDRALGIEAGREAEGITLQLKYLDNRGPEETLPLMEKLILNSHEG